MFRLIKHQWQYNGVDSWNDIIQWCFHNLDRDSWSTNYNETIVFFTDRDYSHFLLRWV
jgi:hypothetical protein